MNRPTIKEKEKEAASYNKRTEIGSRLQANERALTMYRYIQSEHVIGCVMRTVNAQFGLEFSP